MADAFAKMTAGEKVPFYGSITAPTGDTITIVGTATCTLYDEAGAVAGGVNNVSVTGQETGAQSELLAWYVLDSANPPGGTALTVGVYKLVFTIAGSGSDGISRIYKPAVMIVLKSAPDD